MRILAVFPCALCASMVIARGQTLDSLTASLLERGFGFNHKSATTHDSPLRFELSFKRISAPHNQLLIDLCVVNSVGARNDRLTSLTDGAVDRHESVIFGVDLGEHMFGEMKDISSSYDVIAESYTIRVKIGLGAPPEGMSEQTKRERREAAGELVEYYARQLLGEAMGRGINDNGDPVREPIEGVEHPKTGYVRLDTWATARGVTINYDRAKNHASFQKNGHTYKIGLAGDKIYVDGVKRSIDRFVIAKGQTWFVPQAELDRETSR